VPSSNIARHSAARQRGQDFALSGFEIGASLDGQSGIGEVL
jgi:hypothetical protein